MNTHTHTHHYTYRVTDKMLIRTVITEKLIDTTAAQRSIYTT